MPDVSASFFLASTALYDPWTEAWSDENPRAVAHYHSHRGCRAARYRRGIRAV